MAGKRYSREFKNEAVKLVESGTNVRQDDAVARLVLPHRNIDTDERRHNK